MFRVPRSPVIRQQPHQPRVRGLLRYASGSGALSWHTRKQRQQEAFNPGGQWAGLRFTSFLSDLPWETDPLSLCASLWSASETGLPGGREQRHLQLPAPHGEGGRARLAEGLVRHP